MGHIIKTVLNYYYYSLTQFILHSLKDWNIQINYGIKTGFNDAFIISTEKRDEILANCQTEDERVRTAELIRPNTWPPNVA
nr:hypothetical protein [Alistipes onderdonkii]